MHCDWQKFNWVKQANNSTSVQWSVTECCDKDFTSQHVRSGYINQKGCFIGPAAGQVQCFGTADFVQMSCHLSRSFSGVLSFFKVFQVEWEHFRYIQTYYTQITKAMPFPSSSGRRLHILDPSEWKTISIISLSIFQADFVHQNFVVKFTVGSRIFLEACDLYHMFHFSAIPCFISSNIVPK